MKVIASLTVLLVCAAASAEESYEGVEFRRWSGIVSDLDAAIHLYRDILGLELGEVAVDPKTSYVYEMFNIDPAISTRHAMFHAGEKKRVLTVVEVPVIALDKPPQSPRMSVALFNANGRFDAIVRQLQAEKFKVLTPRVLGANGMEIGFLDSDGHLYALYEYPYNGSDYKKLISAQ